LQIHRTLPFSGSGAACVERDNRGFRCSECDELLINLPWLWAHFEKRNKSPFRPSVRVSDIVYLGWKERNGLFRPGVEKLGLDREIYRG
jgi:hypothetical protein